MPSHQVLLRFGIKVLVEEMFAPYSKVRPLTLIKIYSGIIDEGLLAFNLLSQAICDVELFRARVEDEIVLFYKQKYINESTRNTLTQYISNIYNQ